MRKDSKNTLEEGRNEHNGMIVVVGFDRLEEI